MKNFFKKFFKFLVKNYYFIYWLFHIDYLNPKAITRLSTNFTPRFMAGIFVKFSGLLDEKETICKRGFINVKSFIIFRNVSKKKKKKRFPTIEMVTV